MDRRQKWTTSRVVGSPDPPPKYRLIRAFDKFVFKEPVCIAQDPTSDRFMVAEYTPGKIYSFRPNDPAGRKDLFLDMKRGISAFSFHARYSENGYVFVFSHLDPKVKGPQLSRVSRFQLEPGSNPPHLRSESETIIVEWPAGGHNGGEAKIGPDGYLYITTGDGSSGSDPNGTGQSMDDLLAAMMRLDVEHSDIGRNYSIPKDNPFIGLAGARPEIWAYGFRNPWRFSFDPHTGQPWVGDVGQDLWEMIELVERGSNHGWSVMEGTHPFHPNSKGGPTPFVPPVIEHHHTEARSITGGYVYQGDKFPELRDVYLYGDRQPPAAPLPPFPRKLSDTGLFTFVVKHKVAQGVIPYEINAPFWSDGAIKERFFAIPNDGKITFHDSEAWEFEDGAVTVKSFSLDMLQGDPRTRKRIETRIVVKQNDRWVGYTYAWNNEQTEATLVGARGMDRTFSIRDRASPGGVRKQVWHYPSRNECMFCHSRAAGFVLGLTTPQMNRDHKYDAAVDNQLRALSHIGMFKTELPKSPAEYPAYPDPLNPNADLTARVKTYLQVNCSMCHVADGGGNFIDRSRLQNADR